MHGDFQLAGSGSIHILGKLDQIFGMKVGGGVTRRQIPLGLGQRVTCGQREA